MVKRQRYHSVGLEKQHVIMLKFPKYVDNISKSHQSLTEISNVFCFLSLGPCHFQVFPVADNFISESV